MRAWERERIRRKGERNKALALRDLKKAIYQAIDHREAKWNRSLFPEGLCVLPRHCFPSPYLNHPLANFAFLRLVDVFDPPGRGRKERRTHWRVLAVWPRGGRHVQPPAVRMRPRRRRWRAQSTLGRARACENGKLRQRVDQPPGTEEPE